MSYGGGLYLPSHAWLYREGRFAGQQKGVTPMPLVTMTVFSSQPDFNRSFGVSPHLSFVKLEAYQGRLLENTRLSV